MKQIVKIVTVLLFLSFVSCQTELIEPPKNQEKEVFDGYAVAAKGDSILHAAKEIQQRNARKITECKKKLKTHKFPENGELCAGCPEIDEMKDNDSFASN